MKAVYLLIQAAIKSGEKSLFLSEGKSLIMSSNKIVIKKRVTCILLKNCFCYWKIKFFVMYLYRFELSVVLCLDTTNTYTDYHLLSVWIDSLRWLVKFCLFTGRQQRNITQKLAENVTWRQLHTSTWWKSTKLLLYKSKMKLLLPKLNSFAVWRN